MSTMINSGRQICHLDDIEDGSARGFEFSGQGETLQIFIVRQGLDIYAYRNNCPHTGVSLEWLPDQFLNSSGEYIQCATHGALFRIEDGFCVRGPCAGDALVAIPVCQQGGAIICELSATLLVQ